MTAPAWYLFVLVLVLFPALSRAGIPEARDALAKKDYETAIKELRPLAEGGDAEAQGLLASLYQHGKGVPRNIQAALLWYTKAATNGDWHARYTLGGWYTDGTNVKANASTALHWYRLALRENGSLLAAELLASAYWSGKGGFKKDRVKHCAWDMVVNSFKHLMDGDSICPGLSSSDLVTAGRMAASEIAAMSPEAKAKAREEGARGQEAFLKGLRGEPLDPQDRPPPAVPPTLRVTGTAFLIN